MEDLVRISCPDGCDFLIQGSEAEVKHLLWDHLVMVHHSPSVSEAQVLQLASAIRQP